MIPAAQKITVDKINNNKLVFNRRLDTTDPLVKTYSYCIRKPGPYLTWEMLSPTIHRLELYKGCRFDFYHGVYKCPDLQFARWMWCEFIKDGWMHDDG